LTGFKWISKIPDLIFGYEEALGYCVDPASVRDKDGISAAARVCEMVSYYKSHFRDLQQVLDAQAREYGVYATDQLSVRMNDLAQIPAAVPIRLVKSVDLLLLNSSIFPWDTTVCHRLMVSCCCLPAVALLRAHLALNLNSSATWKRL
jgi:hypothetical protein